MALRYEAGAGGEAPQAPKVMPRAPSSPHPYRRRWSHITNIYYNSCGIKTANASHAKNARRIPGMCQGCHSEWPTAGGSRFLSVPGMPREKTFRDGETMKKIRSDIIMNASPEDVWRILTDFAAYPEWNPFIRTIKGTPKAGERLEVHLRPPGRREMVFHPKVIRALKGRELRWIGRLLVAGLFDGEHRFTIEPQADGRVRFIQAELFSGLFVPLLPGMIADTEQGFIAMNRALKERAERFAQRRRAGGGEKPVPTPH
jgi:hypothetical protein